MSLNDRGSMPYLMATLQESLRYLTVAPLGVLHKVHEDTTLDGKHIPANTSFIFNHYALNHDERTFPEPFVFKPERFLDENGKYVAADHANRRAMNAFGSGPRVCVGEPLAKGRIFLVSAAILQRFTFAADSVDGPTSCDIRKCGTSGVINLPDHKVCFIPR